MPMKHSRSIWKTTLFKYLNVPVGEFDVAVYDYFEDWVNLCRADDFEPEIRKQTILEELTFFKENWAEMARTLSLSEDTGVRKKYLRFFDIGIGRLRVL